MTCGSHRHTATGDDTLAPNPRKPWPGGSVRYGRPDNGRDNVVDRELRQDVSDND